MNPTRLDVLVAAFVAGILVLGGGLTWENYRQARVHEEMMGGMGGVHGPDPVWYLLATVLVAGFVAVGYLAIRDQLGTEATSGTEPSGIDDAKPPTEPSGVDDGQSPTESSGIDDGQSPTEAGSETETAPESESGPATSGVSTRPRILDILPEDERRVLEPVIESPGVTQIELRDRSNFSKSKVSQTVSDLEKRGLLYRERQGRTFRVYPSDDLENGLSERPSE